MINSLLNKYKYLLSELFIKSTDEIFLNILIEIRSFEDRDLGKIYINRLVRQLKEDASSTRALIKEMKKPKSKELKEIKFLRPLPVEEFYLSQIDSLLEQLKPLQEAYNKEEKKDTSQGHKDKITWGGSKKDFAFLIGKLEDTGFIIPDKIINKRYESNFNFYNKDTDEVEDYPSENIKDMKSKVRNPISGINKDPKLNDILIDFEKKVKGKEKAK